MEILRREVSVCIIIGLTARRGGERKGKEEVESEYVLQGREACIAGRALKGGGAMKDGAARSLGENEERNRLPWQGEAVSVCKKS